ncbi:recombinase family protein, partial [Limosilactobacillus mucosae]|uniref:recombinase family protein n=1 Tax=Limosilactobacillus mucosae TaxID=97478 RepID=UPI0022E71C6F
NEKIDTSSPMGNLFLTLLASIAEFEREQIKERMMMGKVGRAKSGKAMGTHYKHRLLREFIVIILMVYQLPNSLICLMPKAISLKIVLGLIGPFVKL